MTTTEAATSTTTPTITSAAAPSATGPATDGRATATARQPATSRLRPAVSAPHAGRIATDDAAQVSAWRQPLPGPHLPGLVTGVTLLSGLWLVVGPSLLGYGAAAEAARWNDLVLGIVLVALGGVRLTRFARLLPVTVASVAAGVWLVIAPFVLAYGFAPRSALISFNDMAVGAAVALLALLAHASARMGISTRL